MGVPLGLSALFLAATTFLQLYSMLSVLSALAPNGDGHGDFGRHDSSSGGQQQFPIPPSTSSTRLRSPTRINTAPATRITDAKKDHYVQTVLDSRCRAILDHLDDQFDARRAARQRASRAADALRRYDHLKEKYDLFEPEANCLTEERFGAHGTQERYAAFGDGPKFVCGIDMIREEHRAALASTKEGDNKGCLVYSLGSNNNVDYEQSVHREIGCETHTFDPTLDGPFEGKAYSAFHPWGIGRDSEEREFDGTTFATVSVATAMKKLGHDGRRIDLLKMDIEGAEWEALPELFGQIASGAVVVDQIQVEVHRGEFGKIRRVFEQADAAHMRIMHKERNHWGCDGYGCLEYSFVSEAFLRRHHEWLLCGDGGGGGDHLRPR
jgi:hypothetical protein